jgi:outer membrane biogenesis lipoprotein LolB
MVKGCSPAGAIQTAFVPGGQGAVGALRRSMRVSLALLCLMACARAPSFDLDGSPAGGPQDVIRRINQNALLITSLRADVRLKSDHIPQSRLARADLLFARPQRYRVQFRTIFGNTMAVFTVRQEQADLYLPVSNRLYQGDLTAEGIRELVGVELPAVDLLETLSGIFHLPSETDLLEYRRIGDDHLLVFPWDRGRREIRVAADGYRVLSDRYRDALGEVIVEKVFERYRTVDGVVLPERVRASLPQRQEELEVVFTHQAVDVPWSEEDFRLDLPDGVERIPWSGEYH